LVSGLSGLDLAILGLAVFAVLGLGFKAIGDARAVAVEENLSLGQASVVVEEEAKAAVVA
jgi:hypothetical protein